MGRRTLVIALVVFQAFFLNVLVPGHTRGVVTVAGSKPGISASTQCCRTTAAMERAASTVDAGSGPVSTEQPTSPTPEQRTRCAVCFFATALSPPAPLDLSPPPLLPVDRLPIQVWPQVVSLDHVDFFLARGPPGAL